MNNKTPSDFSDHGEWLIYVRQNIPCDRQAYALARGRTELFKNFYRVRKLAFPTKFTQELGRIQVLPEPGRTSNLESLNRQIFASLTELLFNQAQPKMVEADVVASSPREQIQELLGDESADDVAFARAMVDLDRLLLHLFDRKLALPKYFFERCWFLHYLRGPERMLQTRALLNTLTVEVEPCASA